MLKKALLAVLVFGAATTGVQANQATGYLTGNIGQSDAKGFRNNTATGYKIAVGLQANQYLAVEAQYINLGKAKDKLWAARASSETKGIGANLVGTLPIDEFKLFGKVGYHRLETKSKLAAPGGYASRKKTDGVTSFGVGASYAFTPAVEVVAEYERYRKVADRKANVGAYRVNFEHDVDFASVGLRYNF